MDYLISSPFHHWEVKWDATVSVTFQYLNSRSVWPNISLLQPPFLTFPLAFQAAATPTSLKFTTLPSISGPSHVLFFVLKALLTLPQYHFIKGRLFLYVLKYNVLKLPLNHLQVKAITKTKTKRKYNTHTKKLKNYAWPMDMGNNAGIVWGSWGVLGGGR